MDLINLKQRNKLQVVPRRKARCINDSDELLNEFVLQNAEDENHIQTISTSVAKKNKKGRPRKAHVGGLLMDEDTSKKIL